MSRLDLFFAVAVLSLTGVAVLQLLRFFREWGRSRSLSGQSPSSGADQAAAVGARAQELRNLDARHRGNQIGTPEYYRERSRLTETEVLQTQRDYLMQDLRDLELDFRMNKIDEADYHEERARLDPRALAILKELANREDDTVDHEE